MPDSVPYILGHADAELRRLELQAACLRPITRRMLVEAGVAPGMRVLDFGCGNGEVSLLAAELVGPSGAVLGVDRSAEAVAAARDRAAELAVRNVAFIQGDETFREPAAFDMAVGRYVLIHQASPAQLIQALAECVRPGGTVAFHEPTLRGENPTWPALPPLTALWEALVAAFGSVLQHPDAGSRLVEHFQQAGMSLPTVFCEAPASGGPESPLYAWYGATLRNVVPQLERIGWPRPDVDRVEERLAEAATAARGQILGPLQFCGWSRVPD
ncbi:methyltransferase domain-containing protein [Hansschlegelia beijingensis]|uniref:methyltransferase domain-containing protein n=1 Tax=Hansschlegelia beijingensis TaxID=1133344 RepID=UPI00387F0586